MAIGNSIAGQYEQRLAEAMRMLDQDRDYGGQQQLADVDQRYGAERTRIGQRALDLTGGNYMRTSYRAANAREHEAAINRTKGSLLQQRLGTYADLKGQALAAQTQMYQANRGFGLQSRGLNLQQQQMNRNRAMRSTPAPQQMAYGGQSAPSLFSSAVSRNRAMHGYRSGFVGRS